MAKYSALEERAISVGAGAVFPYSESLLDQCRRKSKYGEEYCLARVLGTGDHRRVLVPRNMVTKWQEDLRVTGLPAKFNSSFVPRNEEQSRVIKESVQLLAHGKNFMVEAPTGFGKTWCATDIIAKVGKKTLVIGTKEDIRDQWIEAFEAILGLKVGKGIGLIQGDTCLTAGQSVVFAMIQSLSKEARYPESVLREFGFVVWDESGAPDTLVTTSIGQIRIQDLVRYKPNCSALSMNTATGLYEWREILAYHEHPPKNPMMRVTHEHGYLDFTSEHLCLTGRGWVRAQDLLGTDCLFLDTEHSFHYKNYKDLEFNNGSMATRDCPRGYLCTNWQDHEQGQIARQTRGRSNFIGYGEVQTPRALRAHTPPRGGESRVGRALLLFCNIATRLANSILGIHILQGRAQNTSAITCNSSVEGVAGVVGDGRWFQSLGVYHPLSKQIPQAGCGVPSIPAIKLWIKKLTEGSQRLLSNVFKRIEPYSQDGTFPLHDSKHDVQARGGSLRGTGFTVQSMRGRNSHEGWGERDSGILPEGNLPEGKEVHELPSKIQSPFTGSQDKSLGMGVKVRVLSVVPIDTPDLVYDIEVSENHNFIANGVVVHNCHRVGADHFAQSGFRVPALLRMGISATPDRSDGREEVLAAHIGAIMVRSEAMPMVPRVIAQRSPWEVPYVRRRQTDGSFTMIQIPHNGGKAAHVVRMLSNHFGRNKKLAAFTAAAYKKGRTILVQSDLKDHLDTLHDMLVSSGVPPADIGFYVGGLTSAARGVVKDTKRVILATYMMTKEATDIPWLDTLVMATPKSDIRQIAGRILRYLPDKLEPVIFDLFDDTSSVLNGYWGVRRKWYKSIGAKLEILPE